MRVKKRKRTCIENYIEVVERYNLQVLNKIGTKLKSETYMRGRPANDAKKQLLVVLWMLVNQECYRTIADRFDITVTMAWEYLQKTVSALVSIASVVITWPLTNHKRQQIVEQFSKRQGVTCILGAIDGTHIPIVAPSAMPNSYVNRNKYHSIILQAVYTANYRFTDVYAGCPGSIHDARVLRLSALGKKLMSYNHDIVLEHHHLLSDSAYPNMKNLITPYKDNGRLSRVQRHFNYKHSAGRVAIEQAFGLLKGTFRILRYVNMYNTKIIPKVIISCCVLHNMCIDMNDVDVELVYQDEESEQQQHQNNGNGCTDGQRKRDELAMQLYRMD
ncbi:hypothetical protein RN001_005859 [Aquatica leii]|uniref:DDE Tnp4 domain-containing protein n=1 Tax=Aquatica leii TaxID=1421715 RepID=A0AAN7SS52_9COLE|nr:hypothetical protein RN001_005859 [Aquatica leii]